MTVVDRFVQARSHGGAMRPTLQVVHSAETPLRAGYAKSIAENWFATQASTSAHFMADPVELIRMLSDNVVSYAVGPAANGFTLNWEQAGYARFSRAEWTTPDGMAQMGRLGAGLRERGLANGIPLRWASDDEIRAAARGVPGGICFHDDIRRVLGGTAHTDPMPNYPRDLLERRWNNPQEDDMSAAAEAAIFDMQRKLSQNNDEDWRVGDAVGDVQRVVRTMHRDFGWALGVLMKREDVDDERIARMVLDGIKADVTTAVMAGQTEGQAIDLSGLGDIVEERLRAVFGDAATPA